jgi:hypothetical protein
MLSEPQLVDTAPLLMRFYEAIYFFKQFILFSGPPRDCYFLKIAYLDGFLFSLVSIEDMNSDLGERLNDISIFKFFKALRNLTTHHSVLAAPLQTESFERPLSRHIYEGVFSSERSQLSIEALCDDFDIASERYPRGKKVFDYGKNYLQELKGRGNKVYWDELMKEVLFIIPQVLHYYFPPLRVRPFLEME